LGGTFGDFELRPSNYELLKVGDRHILFLKADRRSSVPSYTGIDGVFEVDGRTSGDFRVDGNSLKVYPLVAPALKTVAAGTIENFISQIQLTVRNVGER